MKTAILPGAGLAAGLVRVALQSAVAIAALAITAGNVFGGATVNWISGGPNTGYPTGAGYVDGDITTEAEYHTPSGLAIDESGDYLLVADRDNNTVRVLQFDINNTGTLLTYSNNIVKTNLFSKPVGVAVDPDYNVFVLNRAKNTNGYLMEFDYTGELIATNINHLTNAGGIALERTDGRRIAVIGVLTRESSASAGIGFGEAPSEVVGFGTGADEDAVAEFLGECPQQPLGIVENNFIEIARIGVQGLRLPGNRRHHVRVAVTDMRDIVVGIEISLSCGVKEPDALPAHRMKWKVVKLPQGRPEQSATAVHQRFLHNRTVHRHLLRLRRLPRP